MSEILVEKKKILVSLLIIVIAVIALLANIPTQAAGDDAPEEVIQITEEVADEYSICPELIQAIIYTESSYNNLSINSSGCYGYMGINGKYWGFNHRDPEDNIRTGTEILMEYVEKADGDLPYALDLYNGLSAEKAEANYENGILSEYSTKVLDKAAELERLHGK